MRNALDIAVLFLFFAVLIASVAFLMSTFLNLPIIATVAVSAVSLLASLSGMYLGYRIAKKAGLLK